MSNFEASMTANAISSGKGDPPETDLDYYSKPENYTGSNLQSLQRFKFAKDKEQKELDKLKTKKVKKKQGFDLFARYRHILKGIIDDDEEEEEEEEQDEADKERSGTQDIAEDKGQAKIQLEEIKEADEPEDKSKDVKVESEDEGRSSSSSMSPTKRLGSPGDDRASPRSNIDLDSPRDSLSGYSSSSLNKQRKSTLAYASSQGRTSVMMKVKLDKEIKARIARERFRKAYRIVILVNKIYSLVASKDPGSMDSGMKTFTDIASEAESSSNHLKNSGLSFDPSFFKAKKEINISSEVKTILCLPSDQRTPEQVQTAMYGLQSLRSFAEYPLHMQEKLAKVAWFEIVPPKRIIIRQGHFAENFYFILSGQAVVTLLLRNPKTGASFVKTATIMRRGMSFGELALLHHSRRTATVTSQGTVQLLTIGRDDFFDIFMSGAGDQIPEHIKFISQCDFMKGWPIDRLLEHPEQCLLHFFKRNVVIVKDSNQSEWLYVVKSGTCQVLKELRGVTPKIGWKVNGEEEYGLPSLQTFIPKPKIDTGLRKRRVKSVEPTEGEAQDQENKRPKENLPSSAQTSGKKYSKDAYSKFPTTQKAHFSAIRDNLEVRKKYEVPAHCKPPKRPEPPKETGGKPPPVFVQVESLKPRDAFGLDTIKFDEDIERKNTSVSLVSRGAECIMLSKEFFVKHANETVKRLIRYSACPYPDEQTFQDNLQTKADWELYKEQLLFDLTSNM